jgi:hypothetical protein
MNRNFRIGDIVKIKGKIKGLDKLYSSGQRHYRRFQKGEIGRIFDAMLEYPPKESIYVQLQILKLWMYRKNEHPFVSYCIGSELSFANKSECEKYEAMEIAERL